MKNLFLSCVLLICFGQLNSQNKIIPISSFNKVIVSPHIQVTFIEGNKESVEIEEISVAEDKLIIDNSGNTLNIYLEGAKTVTKSKKVEYDDYKGKRPIYNGTIVKAIITYTSLNALSLRGEQKFYCNSEIKTDKFDLDLYGELEVLINDIDVDQMKTTIYGESVLNIKKGEIDELKFVCYGESIVEALNVKAQSIKLTAYGEAEFSINVSDFLKVTSYGEATINYKGDPTISKSIVIGDTTIRKID